MKENWLFEDDYMCCEEYVKKYLINKDYNDSQILVYNLNLKLKGKFSTGSISNKLRNIKHLLLQLKLKDNSNIRPLNHFSEKNFEALIKVLNKYGMYNEIDLEILYKLWQSKTNSDIK